MQELQLSSLTGPEYRDPDTIKGAALVNLGETLLVLQDNEKATEKLMSGLKIIDSLPHAPTARHLRSRALSLLGRCKHMSGEALSAEGLFRSAMDDLEDLIGAQTSSGGDRQVLHYDQWQTLRLYAALAGGKPFVAIHEADAAKVRTAGAWTHSPGMDALTLLFT